MSDYAGGGEGDRGLGLQSPSYSELLVLPELLGLQRLHAAPPVHDELLFIIVHQAHELWFKQMLAELSLLVGHLGAERWLSACATLDRLCRIVRCLVQHLDILDTMSPEDFQSFRRVLGSASGMHSEQYRRIEVMSGREPDARGAARTDAASVPVAFARAVQRALRGASAGVSGDPALLVADFERLYASPDHADLRRVADLLLDYDAAMAAWRARHLDLARHMIGNTPGTGGSTGVPYLRAAAERRFFSALHAARARVSPPPP